MSERVLCVAAHPDDETLGCAATLAKHVDAGDSVSIFVLADGCLSRSGGMIDTGLIKSRHNMLRNACTVIGTADLWVRAYKDNQMDRGPLLQVVQDIESHVHRFKPTVVYTHWHGDMNVDHQVVSKATLTACRPLPGSTVKRILMYEVDSSTEWGINPFVPNWFEDVTATFNRKLGAIACYESEMREYPHARSLKAVESKATLRGASVGLGPAEAFVLARSMA